MKKLAMVLGVSVLMVSCGEDNQAKVCECSKIYDEISAKADLAEEAGEDWMEARIAAQAETKGAFEECDKFHKEFGDEKFYEMSQTCK